MSISGILRSENHGQFMLSPDGSMMNMVPDGADTEVLMRGTRGAFHRAMYNRTRNFPEAFMNDTRYAEEEFILFWDAPQSECLTLFAVVIVLICLDAFIARRVNVGSYKYHAAMVVFWLTCGFGYNALYWFRHGTRDGIDWFVGYVLEWMLSLDNLFAFQYIMRVYSAPPAIQHKALFCGVLGAMVWRLVMFFIIGWLMHSIHYVQFLFGFFLIYAGVQAIHGDDEDHDPNEMIFIRMLKKCLGNRLRNSYDLENHHLFVWGEDGRLSATLLVPLIFCIEFSDLIFAVDSVSAKVAQIPNQYIAYSSSVLALLGLRAMYFVIDDLVRYFESLKYGVCFILVFIGGELMISGKYQLPDWIVCIFIVSVFNFCIVLSLLHKLVWPGPPQPSGASKAADACAAVQAHIALMNEKKGGGLPNFTENLMMQGLDGAPGSSGENCSSESHHITAAAAARENESYSMSAGSGEPPAPGPDAEDQKSSNQSERPHHNADSGGG